MRRRKMLSTAANQTFSRQSQCWEMAQTRRLGMQNERPQLPNGPRFSPYHYGFAGTTSFQCLTVPLVRGPCQIRLSSCQSCLTASPGSARSLREEKHRSHPIASNLATPAAFLGNGPDWVRLERPYLDVVEFSQTASIYWPGTLAKQDWPAWTPANVRRFRSFVGNS